MKLESGHERNHEEPRLADYLEAPDKLQELDPIEIQDLLEKAEAMAREIPTGDGKAKYLRFIQAAKVRTLKGASLVRQSNNIQINDEYDVMIAGGKITLQTTAGEILSFSDLANIGLRSAEIDYNQSSAFSIGITEKDQQCWINLRLFKVLKKGESAERKYLYIADRYVIPQLRGNKIGEQLLKIADEIAQANNCELIFATLVPENFIDLEQLKRGHEKSKYKITTKDGKVIAIKKLNES